MPKRTRRLALYGLSLALLLPAGLRADTLTYLYDELDRLTHAAYAGWVLGYSYDALGNRTHFAARPTLAAPYADVAVSHGAFPHIDSLTYHRIAAGCGNGRFCPEARVLRDQMAIFLLRGKYGGRYTPPAATGRVFQDVGKNAFAAAWIEQLHAERITGGCGGGNYCPRHPVTRAQMAISLLRAKHGASYTPPAATGRVFQDVGKNAFAAAWIEQLHAEGITGGCSRDNYCPQNSVTRAQMAMFLVRTFALPLARASTAAAVGTRESSATATRVLAMPLAAQSLSPADLPPALHEGLAARQAVIQDPAASADGTRLVFSSETDALVPEDRNGLSDVFLYDTWTGELRRISVDSRGQEADGPSHSPRMDGFGTRVAFVSEATNLSADDTNGLADVFVHEPDTGQTTRVSFDPWGDQAAQPTAHPAIDGQGLLIAYERPDPDGVAQVYLYDRLSGLTTLVSLPATADGRPLANTRPALSAEGRFLAYLETPTTDLPAYGVHVYDQQSGAFARLLWPVAIDPVALELLPSFSAEGDSIAWRASPALRFDPAVADSDRETPMPPVVEMANPLASPAP